MSTNDHTDHDDRDDEPNETSLTDPDDYHHRQRLKEIHQRRQQVAKHLDKSEPFTSNKEHNQQKGKLANAVALYIAELEPIEKRTDAEIELRDKLPWDDAAEFADKMGHLDDGDGGISVAGYGQSHAVYRACNEFLAEVKPLIEEEENTEWEV
jgi:hypothetical protein